jgi:hypothetical protein
MFVWVLEVLSYNLLQQPPIFMMLTNLSSGKKNLPSLPFDLFILVETKVQTCKLIA